MSRIAPASNGSLFARCMEAQLQRNTLRPYRWKGISWRFVIAWCAVSGIAGWAFAYMAVTG